MAGTAYTLFLSWVILSSVVQAEQNCQGDDCPATVNSLLQFGRKAVSFADDAKVTDASDPCSDVCGDYTKCAGPQDASKAECAACAQCIKDKHALVQQDTQVDTNEHAQPAALVQQASAGVAGGSWHSVNGVAGGYCNPNIQMAGACGGITFGCGHASSIEACRAYCETADGCKSISYSPTHAGGACATYNFVCTATTPGYGYTTEYFVKTTPTCAADDNANRRRTLFYPCDGYNYCYNYEWRDTCQSTCHAALGCKTTTTTTIKACWEYDIGPYAQGEWASCNAGFHSIPDKRSCAEAANALGMPKGDLSGLSQCLNCVPGCNANCNRYGKRVQNAGDCLPVTWKTRVYAEQVCRKEVSCR